MAGVIPDPVRTESGRGPALFRPDDINDSPAVLVRNASAGEAVRGGSVVEALGTDPAAIGVEVGDGETRCAIECLVHSLLETVLETLLEILLDIFLETLVVFHDSSVGPTSDTEASRLRRVAEPQHAFAGQDFPPALPVRGPCRLLRQRRCQLMALPGVLEPGFC